MLRRSATSRRANNRQQVDKTVLPLCFQRSLPRGPGGECHDINAPVNGTRAAAWPPASGTPTFPRIDRNSCAGSALNDRLVEFGASGVFSAFFC